MQRGQAFAAPSPCIVRFSRLCLAAAQPSRARRRPRRPANQAAQLRLPIESPVPPPPQETYLQCVECLAVYHVDPEDVEGTPRVVACSACLHEWLASDADLLWGHDEAVAALAAAARRRVEGSAFVAARGVQRQHLPPKLELESASRRRRRPKYATNAKSTPNNSAKSPNRDDRDDRDDDDDGHYNVFVGNLSFRATEEDLYRAFSGYGAVLSCQIPADASGSSRGFGFVEMRSKESALRAMESLQGASILGRDVSLNEARPRRERSTARTRGRRGKEAHLGERQDRESSDKATR